MTECAICYEDLEATWTYQLECKHQYHLGCIVECLNSNPNNKTCPYCRHPINAYHQNTIKATIQRQQREINLAKQRQQQQRLSRMQRELNHKAYTDQHWDLVSNGQIIHGHQNYMRQVLKQLFIPTSRRIKKAVIQATKKYGDWSNSDDNSTCARLFKMVKHGQDGRNRALAFKRTIVQHQGSPEDLMQMIFDFLKRKDIRFYGHSFASFLLTEIRYLFPLSFPQDSMKHHQDRERLAKVTLPNARLFNIPPATDQEPTQRAVSIRVFAPEWELAKRFYHLIRPYNPFGNIVIDYFTEHYTVQQRLLKVSFIYEKLEQYQCINRNGTPDMVIYIDYDDLESGLVTPHENFKYWLNNLNKAAIPCIGILMGGQRRTSYRFSEYLRDSIYY